MATRRTQGPRYYTTTKSTAVFVGEIMQLLGEYGAESFYVQQKDGQPVAIAFVIHGVAYQMRPQIEGVRARLERMRGASKATPEAVAWAQVRHLLELQLEAIENGVATPAQVFGGLALTSGGRTVAEMIDERAAELMPGESALFLPAGGGDGE